MTGAKLLKTATSWVIILCFTRATQAKPTG
jgi:hypothetical protein